MKIFYSWQSDLPNADNRSFIQSCIDKVVKQYKSVIEIEADRDTRNKTGAPDITNTIFEKIDDCDLFIADVSIINSRRCKLWGKTLKLTPNPNVLLELGYAACQLGWERVICLYNEDYAELDALPFDLRQHRITAYSLKNIEKSVERTRIVEIISTTVDALVKNGTTIRAKRNSAYHRLMGYNNTKNTITTDLSINEIPFAIKRLTLIREGRQLIEKICSFGINPPTEQTIKLKPMIPELKGLDLSYNNFLQLKIDPKEQEEVKKMIHRYFNIEIDDSLFFFGGLKKQNDFFGGFRYNGTSIEEEKYHKYNELKRLLTQISVLDTFAKGLSNLKIIPLAIKNTSKVLDSNIKITICISGENLELIKPTSELISVQKGNLPGYICNYGLISDFFLPVGNTTVHYDDDSVAVDNFDDNPYINLWDAPPTCDLQNCVEELESFIATPINSNMYEFRINSLQANETKWLDRVILVNSESKSIKIKYTITSDHSEGNISEVIQ